ncbi:hypothetical protein M406DRAFT_102146 [Cryphonectria parasitica EP155]|uniref:Uncharacterized protein n=1 Tax=Cryphonectria parasitica (strain ATCC 38755 / EP155) TaxID=660469 RepID=A0A9P4Y6Z6_CRYP1|nr:uncharacterized protein M406DRAFT_102146 [Cryphonectria parasitica EP155]KAF3767878.1 hypothetical protein M406DRAFT_102146 [Cryphonectria parasitica EP155]
MHCSSMKELQARDHVAYGPKTLLYPWGKDIGRRGLTGWPYCYPVSKELCSTKTLFIKLVHEGVVGRMCSPDRSVTQSEDRTRWMASQGWEDKKPTHTPSKPFILGDGG